MENKKAEEIMQSKGVIQVSYNGMPVWIESIRGDVAEVSFIGTDNRRTDNRVDIPIRELTEGDPLQTI